jgi:hypothetical protein
MWSVTTSPRPAFKFRGRVKRSHADPGSHGRLPRGIRSVLYSARPQVMREGIRRQGTGVSGIPGSCLELENISSATARGISDRFAKTAVQFLKQVERVEGVRWVGDWVNG